MISVLDQRSDGQDQLQQRAVTVENRAPSNVLKIGPVIKPVSVLVH
jgi:hypothetical protein